MLRSLLCGSDLGLEKVLRVSVLTPLHFGYPGLCHAVKLVAKIPVAPVSNWSSPKGHIQVYLSSHQPVNSLSGHVGLLQGWTFSSRLVSTQNLPKL